MRLTIEVASTQPLTGTIAGEGDAPRPFASWLELLRALGELLSGQPALARDA